MDRAAGRVLLALASLAALMGAGCQERGLLAARSSPAGIPVAIEGVEGPPATVRTAFASELSEAATEARVDLVGAGAPARYRVKGFLTAEPTPEGGTALAFVWDVFDAVDQRRARRLTGASLGPSGAGDPWDGLDREALRRLAARSMEEIAGFLVAGNRAAPTEDAPNLGEPPPAASLGLL